MDSSCTESTYTDFDEGETEYTRDFNASSSAKSEDPLEEPIVRISLQKIQISSYQLINMSVKELNKRLSSCPSFVVAKLKRCRRTLKNRGYAKNCRIRRMAARDRLEQINIRLVDENRELKQRNRLLLDQLTYARNVRVTSSADSSTPYSNCSGSSSDQGEQYARAAQSYPIVNYEVPLQPCSFIYPYNVIDNCGAPNQQPSETLQVEQEFEASAVPHDAIACVHDWNSGQVS